MPAAPLHHLQRLRHAVTGLTLLELLVVVAIAAALAAIAVPSYQAYVDRARNASAIADIKTIEAAIERYQVSNLDRFPPDLAAVGMADIEDPWGNPYEYLNIANATKNITGKTRKDRNLHPLNSDYDLYSKGADGKSATPLTAAISKDDIIRAHNGGFIGLGADY